MPDNRTDPRFRTANEPEDAGARRAAPSPSPLAAASALGDFIRTEHGIAGLKRYTLSLNPLLPYDMIEQLAGKFGIPVPPKPPEPVIPPPDPKPEKNVGLSPEQLMLMMNALGGGQTGGGLDPSLLMQLMKK